MRFTKMHGAGNDYVFVDCFQQPEPNDPQQVAFAVSDRHMGIGSDGLILICPSTSADAEMKMWNADGSLAEMCGNGLRCVAKYLFEHGIVQKTPMQIATGSGAKNVDLFLKGKSVEQVRLNMGQPMLGDLSSDKRPEDIGKTGSPLNIVIPPSELNKLLIHGEPEQHQRFQVTPVSMGNPHCVTFVEELSDDWVLGIGPYLEKCRLFPQGSNAEFVQVLSDSEIRMRVWERGSGETLACGTGACASVVASAIRGRTGRDVLVHLPGGTLKVDWDASGDVFLTGPATESFHGEWFPANFQTNELPQTRLSA